MKLTFPDFLTLLRFFLTIPILWLMVQNNLVADITALILYIIAAISDYYDGVLARRWNQVSNFGKFFDPLADKFMVSSILILMVFEKIIDPWLLMVLINRDLIVGGVRSLASTKGLIIGASASGKWKTAVQMVSIPIVVLGNHYNIDFVYYLGYCLLWFTTILSLYSGLEYVKSYLSFDKK